jgi:ribosome-associated protein
LDLRNVRGIADDIRERLVARLGPRLRVVVDRHRSQARNRERALDEMELRIREALVVQRSRRPTRPRRGAVERRLEAKRQKGARKAERRRDWD